MFGPVHNGTPEHNVEISIESLEYADALRNRLDTQKLDFILEDWMSPVSGGYKWLNIMRCAVLGLLHQGAFDRLKYALF